MDYQYTAQLQQHSTAIKEHNMNTSQWIYNKGYAILIKKGIKNNIYFLTHVKTGDKLVGTNLEGLKEYLSQGDLNDQSR